jgi:hypothetical protein
MNSSIKSKPVYQKFCKVCQDAGKSLAEFTSHNVRESKEPNARVTCPTLLSQECRFCFKAGHTIKFCNQIKKQEVKDSIAKNRPVQEKRPAEKLKAPSNVFQLLLDSEEEGEISDDEKPIKKQTLPIAPGLTIVKDLPIAKGLPIAPGLTIAKGLPIAPGLSWPSLNQNQDQETNARPVLSYKKIIDQVNEPQVNEHQVNEPQVNEPKPIESIIKKVEPIVIKRVVLKNGWLDDSDSDEEEDDAVEEQQNKKQIQKPVEVEYTSAW